ncbi:MAG: phosphoribosyl-AMP cyclohydrolase [Opitutales bacterium]
MSKELEESTIFNIDFTKLKKIAQCQEDVIPAIAQCAKTGEILILGYANKLALDTTFAKQKATFWSTSRNELWTKGETSGDFLELVDVLVNCEQNSIVYKVNVVNKGSCHTKKANGEVRYGCYYRKIQSTNQSLSLEFLPNQK